MYAKKRASSLVRLGMSNDDEDEEIKDEAIEQPPKDSETTTSGNNSTALAAIVDPVLEKWKAAVATIRERLPPSVVVVLETVAEKCSQLFPVVRTIMLSFVAGAIVMFGTLTVPVYNEVQSLAEPVTLFETILGDLNRGYVDPVDTQKLFETGVTAMLRSLDPYTEFEGKQDAVQLSESIGGKYGGVGLVISGATPRDLELIQKSEESTTEGGVDIASSSSSSNSKLLPNDAVKDNNAKPKSGVEDDDDDQVEELKLMEKVQKQGIQVVAAFEGYAFDYGMRVGDRLLTVDGNDITAKTSVEDVRNLLRGDPGTSVVVSFAREGVSGVQTVVIPRTVVRINDVKLTTFVGDAKDGIGYIQLSGFASDAGSEVRNSIIALQRAAEEASGGTSSLKGLILDMRGNPGGLLTSAVDVASLFVPKGSDIVSAKGRGFPGVLYRSRVDPILDSSTKLAVLVNGGTASAAEIVSGAIQDLDVGIIVGSDRTFGKGLVQSVDDLPFDTALKLTVAKYYTPSGRCIQGITYSEGEKGEDGGKYKANRVADKDREVFYTSRGREVKDGGGIEADYKVEAPEASALEITLLRSGVVADFAAQWCRTHELTNNFEVDDETYREFQAFVNERQKSGEIKLEALYNRPIADLRRTLKRSGYKDAARELNSLKQSILRDVQRDFDRYRKDIKEDIAQGILARYLPESMLIERSLQTDTQVLAAAKLVRNTGQFDTLLAQGSDHERVVENSLEGSTLNAAASREDEGAKLRVNW